MQCPGGTRLRPGPAEMQPAVGKRNTLCTVSQEHFVSPEGDPVKKKCSRDIYWWMRVGHEPALCLPAQRASRTLGCIEGAVGRVRSDPTPLLCAVSPHLEYCIHMGVLSATQI